MGSAATRSRQRFRIRNRLPQARPDGTYRLGSAAPSAGGGGRRSGAGGGGRAAAGRRAGRERRHRAGRGRALRLRVAVAGRGRRTTRPEARAPTSRAAGNRTSRSPRTAGRRRRSGTCVRCHWAATHSRKACGCTYDGGVCPIRIATGLAMRTARCSRAPKVSCGTRNRKLRTTVYSSSPMAATSSDARVPLPPVRRPEPGGRHVGARRALADDERARRHVAQALVAGRQQRRHDRHEADRDQEEVDDPHGGPQERLLEPHGGAVGADHPQPHGRLAQRAPVPQRLEPAEPGDDDPEAREDGDQGSGGAVELAARQLEHDEQQDADDDGQRQHVDQEGDGARGDPGPLEVEDDRLGGDDGLDGRGACHGGTLHPPRAALPLARDAGELAFPASRGHRPLHRPQPARLAPARRAVGARLAGPAAPHARRGRRAGRDLPAGVVAPGARPRRLRRPRRSPPG